MTDAGRVVDFFYGIGSRYSYLASTRLAGLQAETGARFAWHPLSSTDLMARRGQNPFVGAPPSGQYDWAYRRRDAEAWAAYYGVPFRDPHGRLALDSRLLALACVAARRLGGVERYGHALFRAVFVDDLARVDRATCIERAVEVGLGAADFERALDAPETLADSTAIVDDAMAKGVFGVPTFVLEDRLFWGNDRLVLLRHALEQYPIGSIQVDRPDRMKLL